VSRPAAIRVEGLAAGYDGAAVIDDVSVELAAGETLAVLGTNGSGKSTFVTTLVGLLPPVHGEVRVLGGAPGASPARVAYLGQINGAGIALRLRARDVVTMGRFAARGLTGRMRPDDRALVARSMQRMGVARLADDPVAELSGGQRQRVHIAQALAWRADLLVLDEPTAGLDVAGRALMLAALEEERARGAAVVMCTHDIRDATTADQALLLAGRVVACGPPATAMTRDALMATFGLVLGELPGGGELVMDPVHRHDHHGDGHDS